MCIFSYFYVQTFKSWYFSDKHYCPSDKDPIKNEVTIFLSNKGFFNTQVHVFPK